MAPPDEWTCQHGLHAEVSPGEWVTPRCGCLRPTPTGVRHFDWLHALTAAVAAGTAKADALGMAMVFTTGGFDYLTGRQLQAKSPAYMADTTEHSKSTWQRHIRYLRQAGWLTPYAETQAGAGSPTPLYLLTIPGQI